MYPHGNFNGKDNPHSSKTNGFQSTNYANFPNQAYYFQVQQQQQQQAFNVNSQVVSNNLPQYNAPPLPMQTRPTPSVYQESAEDKQRRYKMEQQRKFKNFGKEFKNTNIDSMLSNIISSSGKSTSSVKSDKKEDDFGDFLQATVQQPPPSTSVQDQAKSFQTPSSIKENITPQNSYQSSNHQTTTPTIPEIDLQTKMMSSLDLRASQHTYQKFKPIVAHSTKRHELKTFQPSSKAANWSALDSVEDAFQTEQTLVSPANVRATEPSNKLPSWVSDVASAPMVYKHVYEASVSADGLMDTSRLYPILLQCNLPNEVLGELWSVANKTVPGRLTQQELFILLALIALTQKGHANITVGSLVDHSSPPVPYMAAYDMTNDQANLAGASNVLPSATTMASTEEDEFDDFQDFQSISAQVSSEPKSVSSNLPVNTVSAHPADSPVSSLSATPGLFTSVLPTTLSSNLEVTPHNQNVLSMTAKSPSQSPKLSEVENNMNDDDNVLNAAQSFAAFNATNVKTNMVQNESVSSSLTKAEQNSSFSILTSCPNKPQPGLVSKQPANEDKYAAFSSLSTDPELLQTFPNNFPPSNNLEYPTLDPPSYSSVHPKAAIPCSSSDSFASCVTSASAEIDVSRSDLKTVQNDNVVWSTLNAFKKTDSSESLNGNVTSFQRSATDSPLTLKSDRFKPFHSLSTNKLDSLSVKSDEMSVKSLELSSLSHAISQQSLGVLSTSEKETSNSEMPKSPSADYGPSFEDDDYGFSQPPPDMPPDSFDEFDVYQEGNSTLMDFDAFAAFEPPKKLDPPSSSVANVSVASRKTEIGFSSPKQSTTPNDSGDITPPPPLLRPSAVSEESHSKEVLKDGASPSQRIDSFSSSETEEEFNDFPIESNMPVFQQEDVSSTDKYNEFLAGEWKIGATNVSQDEVYAEKWEKCLSVISEIINKTNDLFSSIQSPSVCNEVVYSCKGQRFITDLSEVYGVARRVCYSIGRFGVERENLQQLHKQIELAWNNIVAFCPNTPVTVSGAVTDNNEVVCGICLIPIDGNKISYAGRDYHATCANFWINSVESTLPGLQLPLTEDKSLS